MWALIADFDLNVKQVDLRIPSNSKVIHQHIGSFHGGSDYGRSIYVAYKLKNLNLFSYLRWILYTLYIHYIQDSYRGET